VNNVVLAQLLAIALVIAIVALAVVAIPVRRGGPPTSASGTDPRGWRGFVYLNPDDPALFVPNRLGPGRTLNLGHRWVWRSALLVLGVILGAMYAGQSGLTRS
jgi:uncharacterized membrane protein